MNIKKLCHDYSFILIIPLIYLVISCLFRFASGPFWQYADCCYIYLFNALQVVNGQAPVDVTHPGTPLQVFIALIIGLFNLGQTASQTVKHVLIDPEFYLGVVYICLLFLSFSTSILLSLYVYRKTGDKLAALLTPLPSLSFLIMPSFDSTSYPVLPVVAALDAESVFMIVMNLFNLLLLRFYFFKTKQGEFSNTLWLAFICGLGLATKFNFLAILFLAFLIVPFRLKPLFIVSSLFSFIFCTIPIVGKYPKFFKWIAGMLEHSSRYGSGPKGFLDPKLFISNLGQIIHLEGFFVIIASAFFFGFTILLIKNYKNKCARFIGALTFCCLLQTLITAKHYSLHYLLSGIALFSSILPLFYLFLKNKIKLLKIFTTLLIVLFVAIIIFSAIPYYQSLLDLTEDIQVLKADVHAQFPVSTIIPSNTQDINFFISKEEALQEANDCVLRARGDELSALYPNSFYFFSEEINDPGTSYGIWDFKKRILADDILTSQPYPIFLRYTSDFSNYPYQVRLLDHSKYLSAYLLVGSTEKLANDLFAKTLELSANGDFQHAFMLGLKCKELHFEPRGQLEFVLERIYNAILRSKGEL